MNQTGAVSSSAAPMVLLLIPVTAFRPLGSTECKLTLETATFFAGISVLIALVDVVDDPQVFALELFHAPHEPVFSDSD
jgi:hypothetical protein